MEKLPCLDMSVGSLGQGLSIANGMAWALKRQQSTSHVFCLIGDGEQQEGQIWEAAMFAAQHKLDNVCLIVDVNGLQLVDAVTGIKNMNAAATQWQSFGWHATCVDGRSIPALYEAFRQAKERRVKPSVILANMVKGKGVSYMENQAEWHGTAPNERQYKSAMRELTREER